MADKACMLFVVFSGIRFAEKYFIIDSEVHHVIPPLKLILFLVDHITKNYIFVNRDNNESIIGCGRSRGGNFSHSLLYDKFESLAIRWYHKLQKKRDLILRKHFPTFSCFEFINPQNSSFIWDILILCRF